MADVAGAANLIVVDPGHFHAALIQRDMYPWLSPRVAVYSTLSPELLDYLNRISLFNSRSENPTKWQLDIHAGAGFFEQMLRDRAGDAVVFTGRNRGKIDRILATLQAGYHVFADKPWIISSADLPKLSQALELAKQKNLAAYDIMTERYEVTSMLQRELVNTTPVFGQFLKGTLAQPAIEAKSIHHIMKLIAGVPIKRPVWFFDIDEYGEALADVGTHVVDLVQWIAFPARQLDYRTDVTMLEARHWPTTVSQTQFKQVTGESEFPRSLSPWVREGRLEYLSNNHARYTVNGVHVMLDILWNWEAPDGSGDIYEAVFRGTNSRVEIRQRRQDHYTPELYVIPNSPSQADAIFHELRRKIEVLQTEYPGLGVDQQAGEAHLRIPATLRVGHEAHFAQVAKRFFEYMKAPNSISAWERSNMLVKYYISTKGVELASLDSK